MAVYGPKVYEYKLSNRNYDLQTEFDKIILKTETRLLNVVTTAISNVIEEAQTPQAKEGGKMRVDTGFLRHSAAAAINQLPSGSSKGRRRRKGEVGVLPEYTYDEKAGFAQTVLLQMKIGDTFYFGWSAHYAKVREAYDGFLEAAVMNWNKYVRDATERYRKLDEG